MRFKKAVANNCPDPADKRREFYMLPMPASYLRKHLRYLPVSGKIKYKTYTLGHDIGDSAVVMRGRYPYVQINGWTAHASDVIAVLKYGRHFRYDPIDGNPANLRWSNLHRVKNL